MEESFYLAGPTLDTQPQVVSTGTELDRSPTFQAITSARELALWTATASFTAHGAIN